MARVEPVHLGLVIVAFGRRASLRVRGTAPRGSRLKLAIFVLVASLALVAAGCGGDDEASTRPTRRAEASAQEWAGSLCSAVTTWRADLEDAAEPLTDLSSLSEESVRQAADDAKAATDTLADSLRSLGRPDTSSGEQVESAVEDLVTEIENGANEVEAAIEGISSVVDIPSAVTTITTTITDLGTEVDTAVQTLEDADAGGELKTAFDDCRLLRGADQLELAGLTRGRDPVPLERDGVRGRLL